VISFDEVQVGQTLVFQTIDNGFGGGGDFYDRSGVVISKTERTVTLGGVRRGRQWQENFSGTARLRRSDWYRRNVRLDEK
jgi:hypothetical protein